MFKINDSNGRILIELKQISSLMQKKFDFIDQRLEKMEKMNKNKHFKANVAESPMNDLALMSTASRKLSNRSRLISLKQSSSEEKSSAHGDEQKKLQKLNFNLF